MYFEEGEDFMSEYNLKSYDVKHGRDLLI